jgi:hypothetical protein
VQYLGRGLRRNGDRSTNYLHPAPVAVAEYRLCEVVYMSTAGPAQVSLEGEELTCRGDQRIDVKVAAIALLLQISGEPPAELQQRLIPRGVEVGPAQSYAGEMVVGERRVTCYYFYVWDEGFGPAFIKICAYFPYPGKIWFNGHEWAKRQAARVGLSFRELSNGFASCEDPAMLQEICDRLGPGHIQVFAERWRARLPLPLARVDRDAGYWWHISMRQARGRQDHHLHRPPPCPGVLRGPGRRQS